MLSGDIRFDLHTHSTASDGGLTPSALVDCAANTGVTALALTDHDTVDGLAEACQAATARGITLIDGVEISVSWQKRTLHIVGLGIEPQNSTLATGLAKLQEIRQDRARRIAGRLEKLGLERPLEKARALTGHAQITRTHFARLLVQEGLCRDMKQAFRRYLGAGKQAHVSVQWAELDEAVEWIHAAGGVATLAHPLLYNMTAAWRQRMYHAFRDSGGDAMEVCCGHANAQQIQQSAREALQHELMGSVGSDFHSHEQRWLKLGQLAPLPRTVTPVWSTPRLSGLLQ